jgi:hypothetical protein
MVLILVIASDGHVAEGAYTRGGERGALLFGGQSVNP